MYPRPIALGLTLCDNAIVERETNKISLIGQIQRFQCKEFPAVVAPYWLAATLTGSMGTGMCRFELVDVGTLDSIKAFDRRIRLADRFRETQLLFRISHCTLPADGWYNWQLSVDGEIVAERRVLAQLR